LIEYRFIHRNAHDRRSPFRTPVPGSCGCGVSLHSSPSAHLRKPSPQFPAPHSAYP
jgi:hypothetical protein